MKKSETGNLSVEISFLEGLRKRMPQNEEILKVLGDDYTRVGRLEKGLEVDLELARLSPEDPLVYYNLACSLSLLGRLKESVEALTKAIRFGYQDWNWLQKDPDLNNLRKSNLFEVVSSLIKAQSKQNIRLS